MSWLPDQEEIDKAAEEKDIKFLLWTIEVALEERLEYMTSLSEALSKLHNLEICGECLGVGLGAHGSGEHEDNLIPNCERQCGPSLTTTEIVERLKELSRVKRERDKLFLNGLVLVKELAAAKDSLVLALAGIKE